MALSPWPTTPAALATATTRLKAAISAPDSISDERIGGIGAAASAMIERYAPGAPVALRDEALIRAAGYLLDAGTGAVAKESVGPLSLDRVTNHAPAFRNCGAAALLSRWRVRRAGAIG